MQRESELAFWAGVALSARVDSADTGGTEKLNELASLLVDEAQQVLETLPVEHLLRVMADLVDTEIARRRERPVPVLMLLGRPVEA